MIENHFPSDRLSTTHELFTLEDLDIALQGVSEKATAIREDMQTAANRMKAITTIQNAVADCEKHKSSP